MNNPSPTPRPTSWIVPVFPLANVVFFPATALPLHVFEPRYQAMVRDVKDADRLIAISLQKGEGFHDLGTLGRIRDLEPLDGGRYRFLLTGLERISMTEVQADTPYRQVRIEPLPERTGSSDLSIIDEARLELLASHGMLRSMVQGNEPLVQYQDLPFEVVVNTACSGLPIEAGLRQQLLREETLLDRQRLAGEYFTSVIEAMNWLKAMKDNTNSATH